MNKDNWYIVDDIDEFVLSTRKLIYNHFGKEKSNQSKFDSLMLTEINPDEQEEFDQVLTQEESLLIAKNILKKQTHKKSNEVRYLVSDNLYRDMVESLNDRMVSNILNSLVNKGYLESGYDAESNDFVFWIKEDQDEQNKEKPETD